MTKIPTEDLKLLSEIAMSAAVRGQGPQAKPIFEALARLQPNNAAAAIGYALTELTRGRFQDAVQILQRDGIKAKAGAAEAKAILMVSLVLAGRSDEARSVQRELIRNGDGPAKQIAQLLMKKVKINA